MKWIEMLGIFPSYAIEIHPKATSAGGPAEQWGSGAQRHQKP